MTQFVWHVQAREYFGRAGDPAAEVEDAAIASLEVARVRRQLASLPPLERRVVCWRWGIGCAPLSRRAVASRLQIPVSACRRLEEHALELLRSVYLEAA